MLEKLADVRETEWQKLARAVGFEPTTTLAIFREMLVSNGEDRTLAPVFLVYHQVSYWRLIEFEDLPVLQAVINSFSSLLSKNAEDLDILTYIFSGAVLLLYALHKNGNGDTEDIIEVELQGLKQLEDLSGCCSGRGSFRGYDRTLHARRDSGNLNNFSVLGGSASSNGRVESTVTPSITPIDATTPPSPIPSTPSSISTFLASLTPANDARASSMKLFRPLRSSSDFFAQMKQLVGKLFGHLLANIASKFDPLLESTILLDNFSTPSIQEIPSLTPLTNLLQKALSIFQASSVHLSLSQQFFSEVFLRINDTLMNGVLLRQQLCTEAFGAYLKRRIEFIVEAADEMGKMWIGDADNCLQGIKQIANVLTLQNKAVLAEEKHRRHVCPNLTSLQLRQLLALYTPGEYGKRVPVAVINSIAKGAPTNEYDKILPDVNFVRPFPVKVLHYFETEDMHRLAISQNIRGLVERLSSYNK